MMPSGRSQAVSGAVRGAVDNGIYETADSTEGESSERTGCSCDRISCTASFVSHRLLSRFVPIRVAEAGEALASEMNDVHHSRSRGTIIYSILYDHPRQKSTQMIHENALAIRASTPHVRLQILNSEERPCVSLKRRSSITSNRRSDSLTSAIMIRFSGGVANHDSEDRKHVPGRRICRTDSVC
jgi:hypothetical protein